MFKWMAEKKGIHAGMRVKEGTEEECEENMKIDVKELSYQTDFLFCLSTLIAYRQSSSNSITFQGYYLLYNLFPVVRLNFSRISFLGLTCIRKLSPLQSNQTHFFVDVFCYSLRVLYIIKSVVCFLSPNVN